MCQWPKGVLAGLKIGKKEEKEDKRQETVVMWACRVSACGRAAEAKSKKSTTYQR